LKINLAEKETNFIEFVEGPHVFNMQGWSPGASTYAYIFSQ